MLDKVYCKDCKYLETGIDGYGRCKERVCQNPVCFSIVHDPVYGPIEERTANCRELNRDCDCQYFEQGVSEPKKKWWQIISGL